MVLLQMSGIINTSLSLGIHYAKCKSKPRLFRAKVNPMKLATFNLYQFVAAGGYWHTRDPHNTYSTAEWQQKQQWVRQRLQDMDADIVGFQEVFSVAALQELCAEAGYPHFAAVDTPRCLEEDPAVHYKSVVALASRFPLQATGAVNLPDPLPDDLPLSANFRFSRVPVWADIAVPDFGILTVYVVHLKSKRPSSLDVRYAEDVNWQERVADTMQRLSRSAVGSLLQRGAEAALLYQHINTRLRQNSSHAIAVLGDMNDSEDSVPLAALTMQGRVFNIGGVDDDAWPDGVREALHTFRLADSFRLAPNTRHSLRPFTKVHRGQGIVLDYILVSNTLNPKNPKARAEVVHYQAWNRHLDADGVADRLQSDHGQVCVELRPCSLPASYAHSIHQRPAHAIQSVADILTRDDFIAYAGGIYQSPEHYKQWGSTDKWENFWSFFFDNQFGWVTTVYGNVPISTLYQQQHHSIEHVIPLDFLDRYLSQKGMPRHVRNGASTNPFNLMPSERGLNAKRSNFPFDWEGDVIVRPFDLELDPDNFRAGTGFDAEHEWVIPSRNRGDVARAILYMLLVYGIDELYNRHLDTLVHWAKVDSPSAWEMAYNNWVASRLGIRNPFIAPPEEALPLLNNRDLLAAIEHR